MGDWWGTRGICAKLEQLSYTLSRADEIDLRHLDELLGDLQTIREYARALEMAAVDRAAALL